MLRTLIGLLLLCLLHASPAQAAQKWAVLVGIDQYQRPDVTPLRCAVADVRAVAAALKTSCGFSADNVFVLTSDKTGDDAPTRTNVAFRLGWLGQRVKADDTVVFYFSGHGIEMDQKTFLLTVEADARDVSTLEVSGLESDFVQRKLRDLKARNLLVCIDACRNDPRAGRGSGDNKLSGDMARDLTVTGRQAEAGGGVTALLLACSEGQRSYEWTDKKQGYFSYFLVEGLKGAAADAKGQVTLPSLQGYLEREVPRATERAMGMRQVPFMSIAGSGVASFSLAWGRATPLPAAATQPQPKPPLAVPEPDRQKIDYMVEIGQSREAVAMLDRSIAAAPDNAFNYALRSSVRRSMGDLSGALADAEKAVALDPNGVDGYLARGVLLNMRGEKQRSLQDFDRALKLKPGWIGYNNRALVRMDLGWYEPALQDMNEAMRLEPSEYRVWLNRGRANLLLSRWADAEKDLSTAIRLKPKRFEAWYFRAYVYRAQEKFVPALSDGIEAVRLNPKDPSSHADVGVTFIKVGKYADALNALNTAAGLDASNPYILFYRGVAHASLRNHRAAIIDFTRAIELAPTDAEAYFQRGESYRALGDKTNARADYASAMRLKPEIQQRVPR